jgi:hypothetical protein
MQLRAVCLRRDARRVCGCTGPMNLELYQEIVAGRPDPDLRERDRQRVNFCES